MKLKQFLLDNKSVEKEINDFLTDHENDLDETNGIHVFPDRVVYLYDDADLDYQMSRVAYRTLKDRLFLEVKGLEDAKQNEWAARLLVKQGTAKPDDVLRIAMGVKTCQEKIDYMKEQLNGFIQHA